ncbi:MAG: polysaccharide deacetylase family protein [Treponema sp.]
MKSRYLFAIFCLNCLLNAGAAFAGIKFGEADINAADKIAFTVSQSFAGAYSYSSAFTAQLSDGVPVKTPEPITYFPEKMELLSDTLQIRNRYGIVQYDFKSGSAVWKKLFRNLPVNSMRALPAAASPDGKWQCIIEKTRYASGILLLEQTGTGKRVIMDSDSALNYERVPVKWCGDSSVFVYEKGGNVYFCKPDAFIKGIDADDKYRKICAGSINSVQWADDKNLVYIDGDIVYKIGAKEFYTRALYSEIIGSGIPIGRLPERFIPSRDVFSINSSLASLVVVKSAKFFSSYKLKSSAGNYLEILYSGAYIPPNASVLDAKIFWGSRSEPFICFRLMPYSGGKITSAVYKLSGGFLKILEIEDSGFPELSPDGLKCTFASGTSVYVYDTSKWSGIAELNGENTVSVLWKNNEDLIVGGSGSVRLWNCVSGNVKTLFASSAKSVLWSEDGTLLAADTDAGQKLFYDVQNNKWTENSVLTYDRSRSVNSNGNYRVFCGRTSNSNYENALYVRSLTGKAVTKAVFLQSAEKISSKKKAALIFDAYDTADGLPRILYELALYKIKGTFFLNGEFIRRYPDETRQIADSGNECASMFFTLADFSNGGFVPDEAFIRRGLARNEDEFERCTEKELSLLWHTPYYKVSKSARSFAEKAGYTYVDTTSNVRDFISLEECAESGSHYYTSADVIDSYMSDLNRAGGGILAVSVGLPRGSRESLLYENLDLLISALLDEGYEIAAARDFDFSALK